MHHLIDSYNEEIDILNEYLPKPLTMEEINSIIDEAFNVVNPKAQSDLGKIMKEISTRQEIEYFNVLDKIKKIRKELKKIIKKGVKVNE